MTTAVEKYEQLPEMFKAELLAIPGEEPESLIAEVERSLENAAMFKHLLAAVIAAVLIGLFFYGNGWPVSIWGWLGYIFLALIFGFSFYLMAFLAVTVLSSGIYQLFLKKTKRHRFYWAVLDSSERYMTLKSLQDRDERLAELAQNKTLENDIQSDFTAIKTYFGSGKGIFMPRNLLKFGPDELAQIALEYAKTWANKADKSEQERKEQVEIFRTLTALLENVDDDEIVELEERIEKIKYLISKRMNETQNLSDPLITELIKESSRISEIPELQEARTRRMERLYWNRFQAEFPSANV